MIKIGLLILFVLALIIGSPLAAIWAVNTLFETSIAYSFINWLASFVLLLCLGGIKFRSTS